MSANIKVLVRIRPLDEGKKERWAHGMEVNQNLGRIILGNRTFDPDKVLGVDSTQEDVYVNCQSIVDCVKNGSNGTILVYGQTGTGKTHTMLGPNGDVSVYESGIAARAIHSLIEHAADRVTLHTNVSLSLSMLEIYNEKITDMLVREHPEVPLFCGFPHAATKLPLTNLGQSLEVIRNALSLRHVSNTTMNDRSSRSHVIMMLHLEEQRDDSDVVDISRLFLVDLAGSESLKKSNAIGKAASEAGAINKSLLALKSVVLALSSSNGEARGHVPYRDSRLTEILQDSIGGSARTMMVACISPVGRDVEETKSTLDYASKARTIRNISNTERDKMTIRIRSLEMDLQKYRNQLQDKINERNGVWVSKDDFEWYKTLEEDKSKSAAEMELMAELLNQTEGKKNLLNSQIAHFKQIAQDRDEDLQKFKETQVNALIMAEQVETAAQRALYRGFRNAEEIIVKEQSAAAESFRQFMNEELEPSRVISRFNADIERICQSINTTVTATCNKLREIHTTTIQSLLSENRQRCSTMKALMNQLQAETQEKLRTMEAAEKSHDDVLLKLSDSSEDLMMMYVKSVSVGREKDMEGDNEISGKGVVQSADIVRLLIDVAGDIHDKVGNNVSFPLASSGLLSETLSASTTLHKTISNAVVDSLSGITSFSGAHPPLSHSRSSQWADSISTDGCALTDGTVNEKKVTLPYPAKASQQTLATPPRRNASKRVSTQYNASPVERNGFSPKRNGDSNQAVEQLKTSNKRPFSERFSASLSCPLSQKTLDSVNISNFESSIGIDVVQMLSSSDTSVQHPTFPINIPGAKSDRQLRLSTDSSATSTSTTQYNTSRNRKGANSNQHTRTILRERTDRGNSSVKSSSITGSKRSRTVNNNHSDVEDTLAISQR